MKVPPTSPSPSGSRREPLLRLHPADNVLTVLHTLKAGAEISLPTGLVRVEKPLTLGHKVAAQPIGAGEKIIKYGVSIGSATRPIAPGEHVHTHNVKSDYIPTYLREDHGRLYAAQQLSSTSAPAL